MINCVFKKQDFIVCHVPVPKGYPPSQTHVGVYPTNRLLLLSSSPFPNVRHSKWRDYLHVVLRKMTKGLLGNQTKAESFENPCIYSSKDGVYFNLMQSRPLMEAPDAYYGLPAFNSDPDIFVENDTVYVLNRVVFRTKMTPGRHRDEYVIRIYLIKGLLDEGRFKLISISLFKDTTDLIVSPCLTKYKGDYVYTSLWTNCYNDGESFEGLKFIKAPLFGELYDNEDWHEVSVNTDKWAPWHMSVFVHNDRAYSIIACIERGKPHRCWQMLGEFSEDLSSLRVFQTPLTDYKSYRGAAYVDGEGEFFLYNTTVNEQIKGGRSVDGREVIMAHMPFEKLLSELKEFEQE